MPVSKKPLMVHTDTVDMEGPPPAGTPAGADLPPKASSLDWLTDSFKGSLAIKRDLTTVLEDRKRMREKLNRKITGSLTGRSAIFPTVEEIFPDDRPGLVANIMAGLVAGVKISIGMAVFAGLMWTQCPELAAHLSLGVKMNYLTASVLLLVYSLAGQIPYGMVLCQDIPSLLLGKMGIDLARSVEPEVLASNFVALVALQAIISGVIFVLCSSLNYTAMVQQVPHAVVGGFVASCGAGLWRAALSKLTNVPWASTGFWPVDWRPVLLPTNLALVAAGIAQFLAILKGPALIKKMTSNAYLRQLAGPISLITPTATFYVCLAVAGLSLEDMRGVQWLPPQGPPDTTGFWTYWSTAYDVGAWEPRVLLGFVPQMVACSVLALLEAVFNVASIDSSTSDKPLDMAGEVRAFGVGNIFSGLLGANMGYLQGGMTLNANQVDKASHKICIIIAAGFALTLFLTGFPLADFIPKFMNGGVFLLVGYFFLKKWLIDSLKYLPLSEYLSIWVIVLTSLMRDIDSAMLVGFLISAAIYIKESLLVRPIKEIARGDILHSNCTRCSRLPDSVQLLRDEGHRIMVVKCAGFLFWGSARIVVDTILSVVLSASDVEWLLIDLEQVPRLDISAVKAFEKCLLVAKQRQVRIAFSNADKFCAERLQQANLIGVGFSAIKTKNNTALCEYFDTADEALETFEDDLLLRYGGSTPWCSEEQQQEGSGGLEDSEELRALLRDFFARGSEWAGHFVVHAVEAIFVNYCSGNSARVSARYTFAKVSQPGTVQGHDFRQFKLARKSGQWLVVGLSARDAGTEKSSSKPASLLALYKVIETVRAMGEAVLGEYAEGSNILDIGQEPQMVLIVSGEAEREAFGTSPSGYRSMMKRHAAGSVAGLQDLALNRPCSTALVAVAPTTALSIGRPALEILRQRDPAAYLVVADCLGSKLREIAEERAEPLFLEEEPINRPATTTAARAGRPFRGL